MRIHIRIAFCAFLPALYLRAAPPYGLSLFPPDGSMVPRDTPLRIAFQTDPLAARSGFLRVRAANGSVVYSLDFATLPPSSTAPSPAPFRARIGGDSLGFRPLILADREAYFRLPAGILRAGATYQVELDAGTFRDASGTPLPAVTAGAWGFTTAADPVKGRTAYSVSAQGAGDFCTLQGGLDFLPLGNNPVTLEIRSGIYRETPRLDGKNRVTLAGASRDACVIRYANNDAFNPGTRARALARLFGDDIVVRDLTFVNDTPRGGSQAEALFLRGQRCSVRHCLLRSFQDTMLLEGRIYLADTRVEGAVDYVWGTGAAFFRACVLYSNADGYIVQARNGKGDPGYVFAGCTLSAAAGTVRSFLARDGNGSFPSGQVYYIDCTLGSHIPAAGWQVASVAGARPEFAEYGSRDAAGRPAMTSGRAAFSRQLTTQEAARYSRPLATVGGEDGWDPEAGLAVAFASPNGSENGSSVRAEPARSGYDALGRARRKARAAAQ